MKTIAGAPMPPDGSESAMPPALEHHQFHVNAIGPDHVEPGVVASTRMLKFM
jgi:hypothetical protein